MLLMSVRVRPWSERLVRSSSGRLTSRMPSSPLATVIGDAMVCDRVPLGPLTVTSESSIATSTPDGTAMGSLPMRDMLLSLPGLSWSGSPDVGEDFAAHALLVRLAVGQQSLRRRDDRDAEATEDLGQVGALGVDAQAGLADAAHARDGALPVAAVLERHGQRLADGGLALGAAVVGDVVGGGVTLLLEGLREAGLHLAVGHRHHVVVRLVGVAQTREHVCDRVSHRHDVVLSRRGFLRLTAWGPSTCVRELPGGLGDAGELAAVGHLPQADPAQ